MSLRRTLDAGFLNQVANDPEVRPFVGGEGVLDLSELVSSPVNVALQNENGGFLFVGGEPGRYELHTMLLPDGRGAAALEAVAEAFRIVFTETDATEIVTKVAHANRPAALMARRAGFRPIFTRAETDYFSLTLDEWRARDPVLAAEGEAFHQTLEAAKVASGSALETHDHDESHDRAVGAASLMAKAGHGAKAVWSYNRWASFAGYQTIELMSAQPLVIDVRDAVIAVRHGQMEVLLCR